MIKTKQPLGLKKLNQPLEFKKYTPTQDKIYAKLIDERYIFCLEGHSLIDDSFIEISKEKHQELLQINQGYIGYIDEEGLPQVRHPHTKFDKKSKSWIEDKEAIQTHNEKLTQDRLINEAKRLLIKSDEKVLPDKFNSYSETKQQQIVKYRELLREVVRGKSKEIPEII